MQDDERVKLAEELGALSKAQESIRAARKPFDDAIAAIEEVYENLLYKHEVEIAGSCEGCDRLLFVGEMGHRCEDGPLLCEEHAPTYGDVKRQWEEKDDADPDERQDAINAAETHVAAGGSLGDKVLHDL